MVNQQVALLRGINVGRAKRVKMAELRTLLENLGYDGVRTLLNSGNVIFTDPDAAPEGAAARIEEGIIERFGFSSRVTVLTAAELTAAVNDNPLLEIADNPSRLMVAVLRDRADRSRLEPLLEQAWRPETLALGTRVAYLWCPDGTSDSRLTEAVNRLLGDAVTIRNWATVMKLHALMEKQG